MQRGDLTVRQRSTDCSNIRENWQAARGCSGRRVVFIVAGLCQFIWVGKELSSKESKDRRAKVRIAVRTRRETDTLNNREMHVTHHIRIRDTKMR